MKKKIKINQLILLPIFIFLIILIADCSFYFNYGGFELLRRIRSVAIFSAIVLLLIGINKRQHKVQIYGKVKIILLCIFFIYVFNQVSGRIDLSSSFHQNIFVSALFLMQLILTIFVLVLIRELIFVQRKKNTNRNFNILFILLIVVSFLPNGQSYNISLGSSSTAFSPSPNSAIIILVNLLLVYLMVVNSFRISWVKFLNKTDKIKVLLLAIIIQIFNFLIIANNDHLLGSNNTAVYNFFTSCFHFLIVYFSFSIVVILLHLPTAGVYDRKVKEISSLQHLSRFILGVFDVNEVMKIITDKTINVAEAHYCWLMTKNRELGTFELVAQKNLPDKLVETFSANPDNDFTRWIVERKHVLKIDNLNKDPLTADFKSWDSRSGSLLGVPLLSDQELLGILFAGKNVEYGFSIDDQILLTMFANNAVIAIENARLVKQSLDKEKYEQELKVAHEAQMKLLPKRIPEVKALEVEAACQTANEVGGDYYDYFEFGSSKLGIIIGDVSGKGPEAAFYMAEVKGIIESLSEIYFSPKKLLVEANKILYRKLDRRTFVSALYGMFDFSKRSFSFCRAGHCPLLYWNNKKEEIYLIESSGLALGLEKGKNFEKYLIEEKIAYQKGDVFVFFTDGVTEARNDEQEEFEEQRLCDTVFENHRENATSIKNAILDKIKSFVGNQKQHDDLTMIVIRVK